MAIYSVDTSKLITAMGLPQGTTLSITGDPSAYGLGNGTLAGFAGGTFSPYLVLSTGRISSINTANTSGSQGTDLGPYGVAGDTVTLNFKIPLPANAVSFSFDFTFLSEEFPEFVGSIYNDFLSVKLNGVEIARDTSGNPITVNNNFFSPTLKPTGTMFDGQTPPLRIVAPLDTSSPTVDLTITLGDVGDGIYDSAAFLGKFKFLTPQVVYVNFNGGSITWDGILFDKTVKLPSSGKSQSEQDAITNKLNTLYKDFLITFTKDKPSSGEYSTILVGGKVSDLPSWFGAKSGLLGRAEKIDYGNADRKDDAVVLSGHISNNDLLAQVIAHEAGHILGLRHVAGPSELMYPYANPTSTKLGGYNLLAEIVNGKVTPVGGYQDTYNELAKNLGLKTSSKVILNDSPLAGLQKYFSFSLDPSVKKTIYDVNIAIVNDEGEIVSLKEFSQIKPGAAVEFATAAAGDDRVVVVGSTKKGGTPNVFLGSSSPPKTFNLSKQGEDGVLKYFAVDVSKLGSKTLSLSAADSKGKLSKIGKVAVTQAAIDTLKATEGDDYLEGSSKKDKIAGLAGDDMLLGYGGNDTLWGGAGKDILFGGAGNDVLFGGSGKDVFVFDTKPNKKKNFDKIKDFNVKDDSIWLDNAVFKKIGTKGSFGDPAKLNKKFFTVGTAAKDKNDYVIYNKKTGVLYYDADGSGKSKAVEIAQLSKNLKLKADDFFVI